MVVFTSPVASHTAVELKKSKSMSAASEMAW